MTDNNTKTLVGKAYFAKILGNPIPNYNKDGFEWTLDLGLDKEAVSELKSLGLASKIREGNEAHDGIPYITFRRSSTKKAGPKKGEANPPIRVVGPDGQSAWDTDTLIGNGSTIAVRFNVNETVTPQGKKSRRADVLAVQVRELVAYVPKARAGEFDDVSEESELPATGSDW